MTRISTDEDLLECQPGQVLHYDFRTEENKKRKLTDTFRVVEWNIERGTQLSSITSTLQALDADVLLLQELDINSRRSGYLNIPKELARALQMQVLFVCEVEELDSVARRAENSVGPLSPPYHIGNNSHVPEVADPPIPPLLADRALNGRLRHFHGNAILSRCATLSNPHVIKQREAFDWETDGTKIGEPRHGFRSVLRVSILPKDRQPRHLPPLYLYTCHLEVFTGPLMRVRQLADCMHDATSILREAEASSAHEDMRSDETESERPLPAFIIAGDMNTMAHGIVRLNRNFGTDRMRVLGIGETEACWLQRSVLSRGMRAYAAGCCPLSPRFPFYLADALYDVFFNNALVWRYVYGFDKADLAKTDNTHLCLYDPADKYTSRTLNHPYYRGLVSGKLDWLLLSNLSPVAFRSSHSNGAGPVDTSVLLSARSISAETARYLDKMSALSEEVGGEAARRQVPDDGYLLFNEGYTASDHAGLVMTVKQQAIGHPRSVYRDYGGRNTRSLCAVATFILTRPITVVAVVAWFAYRRSKQQ